MPYYEGADVNDRSWVQMIIRVQLSVLKVMKLTMANHIPLRSKNVAIIKLYLSLSQRLCIALKLIHDTSCINSWVVNRYNKQRCIIINMTRFHTHLPTRAPIKRHAVQQTMPVGGYHTPREEKMLLLYVVIQSVLYPSQVFMYPTKYCVPARPALLTSAHRTQQHRSMADGQCI